MTDTMDSDSTQRFHRVVEYRVVRESTTPAYGERCDGVSVASALARAMIPDDGREHLIAIGLDAQNHVIFVHHVSMGSATITIVHPREVFGPAVREGAVALLVAHNHPSGSTTPSGEDVRLAVQLAAAGTVLSVDLRDFLIVTHASDACWSALTANVIGPKAAAHLKRLLGRTSSAALRKQLTAREG